MLDLIINILLYQLEVIGGADKYMAVCRMCHLTPVVPRSPLKQIDNQITKSVADNCEKLPCRSLFEDTALPVHD